MPFESSSSSVPKAAVFEATVVVTVRSSSEVSPFAGVGAEVVGAKVVGAEVVGAEVPGAEVVGAEVVGAEVVGAEVVGAEVVGEAVRQVNVCVARVRKLGFIEIVSVHALLTTSRE